MRQLMITVPVDRVAQVASLAKRCDGVNVTIVPTRDSDPARDMLIINVPNRQLGPIIEQVSEIENSEITVSPYDIVPLTSPVAEIANHIAQVEPRSPFEVWINGWQSMGSLRSYISYALAASIVVWIGMFTGSAYLLVAAMLIAPFAGPATTVAMATAGGDWEMLRRNIGRYLLGLAIMITVTWLISTLLGQKTATRMMVDISEISSLAVLLPLVAGAAGALNLNQDAKSSLVAGAAVGMLVAASLSPPAGLVGMGLALGRWDMVSSGAFVLVLQLLGINLAGAIVFRIYGMQTDGVRYKRGEPRIFRYSLLLSAVVLAALVAYQWVTPLNIQRSTLAQRYIGDLQQALDSDPLVKAIEVNLRFTRSDVGGQHSLLGVLYVQPQRAVTLSDAALQQHVTELAQATIAQRGLPVTPLIDVVVVRPPDP